MNTTSFLSQELDIINYILIAATTSIILICAFWIWYYVASIYVNKREVKSINKGDTINMTSRVQDLRAQRTKNYLFISILTAEMLRKTLALIEYFYVSNLEEKYHTYVLPSNQGSQQECPTDLHEAVMKRPLLILIESLNFTSTLCLVSLVGITMLYLAKMHKGDKKMTSVHGLVIILAIKAVLVLILSSTVFLHVAGYFVWLLCLIFDWFLILIFAIKLNTTLASSKRNYSMPVELKLTTNRTVSREYRVIACFSILVTVCTLIYTVATILATSVDIADLVILRPCFFRTLGIYIADSSRQEALDFIRVRESMIFGVYVITFFFDSAIIASHFFFLFKHGKKIFEKFLCRPQKQVLSYDKNVLEEPLLNDADLWTDETFVTKVEGSSIN